MLTHSTSPTPYATVIDVLLSHLQSCQGAVLLSHLCTWHQARQLRYPPQQHTGAPACVPALLTRAVKNP